MPAVSPTTILLAGSTVLAFALAAIATPLVGLIARQIGMLDIPGGRRRHPRPIPRPGGLAIAIAFGTAIFAFWLIDRLAGHPFLIPEEVRSPRFTLTAIAALLGMAIGLVDDVLELRARWQFLGQVLVAAVIVLAGIHIDFVNDPLSDRLIQLAFPVAVAFTFPQSTRMKVMGHAASTQPIVPPMRTTPNSFWESFICANAIELVIEIVGT